MRYSNGFVTQFFPNGTTFLQIPSESSSLAKVVVCLRLFVDHLKHDRNLSSLNEMAFRPV